MTHRRSTTTPRPTRARTLLGTVLGGAALSGAALGLAACGGSADAGQAAPPSSGHHATGTHRLQLTLASGQGVTADLPSQPLGTTSTQIPGVKLDVWQAQRSGQAVTVVFSLDNTTNQSLDLNDQDNLQAGLNYDANNDKSSVSRLSTSNVALLDTGSLKSYETFCDEDSQGVVQDCLASSDGFTVPANADVYLAAVVAAPPSSTGTATLVTGDGSVPAVPIS